MSGTGWCVKRRDRADGHRDWQWGPAGSPHYADYVDTQLPFCEWDLANGFCEEVAEHVERLLIGLVGVRRCDAEPLWLQSIIVREGAEDEFDDQDWPAHMVIALNGRYYDAQNPDGVDDWRDLDVVRNISRDAYLVREFARGVARDLIGHKTLHGYVWVRSTTDRDRPPYIQRTVTSSGARRKNIEALYPLADDVPGALTHMAEEFCTLVVDLATEGLPPHIKLDLVRFAATPYWGVAIEGDEHVLGANLELKEMIR